MNPTVLHEESNEGKTIIEKLEKYSEVGYAFVILTPDVDNLRANQNVIFEFGFLVGVLGRHRISCLVRRNTELPSDMHGLKYHFFEHYKNINY